LAGLGGFQGFPALPLYQILQLFQLHQLYQRYQVFMTLPAKRCPKGTQLIMHFAGVKLLVAKNEKAGVTVETTGTPETSETSEKHPTSKGTSTRSSTGPE
jgi:hypothetical protein